MLKKNKERENPDIQGCKIHLHRKNGARNCVMDNYEFC